MTVIAEGTREFWPLAENMKPSKSWNISKDENWERDKLLLEKCEEGAETSHAPNHTASFLPADTISEAQKWELTPLTPVPFNTPLHLHLPAINLRWKTAIIRPNCRRREMIPSRFGPLLPCCCLWTAPVRGCQQLLLSLLRAVMQSPQPGIYEHLVSLCHDGFWLLASLRQGPEILPFIALFNAICTTHLFHIFTREQKPACRESGVIVGEGGGCPPFRLLVLHAEVN